MRRDRVILVAALAGASVASSAWWWTRAPRGEAGQRRPAAVVSSARPAVAFDVALVDLLAAADPAQRVGALRAWFRANLPARLAEVRGFFARMHEQSNPDLFTAFQVFLEEWGALDGAGAYQFAYASPERSGIDGYAEFAIRGWLRGDFDGLWKFVQSQQTALAQDDDRVRWAVTWFTEALLDANPERFFSWAEAARSEMSPALRDEIARTAAFHASDDTIERVGDWLGRNAGESALREIVGEFARRYAEMKPQRSTEWAIALENPAHRGAAAMVVARKLAAQDYELGVTWLARPEVVQSLRTAPAEWRAGQPPSSAYDAAVAEYLSTLARHHGDDAKILAAAEKSIAAIEDPAVRQHLAHRLDEVRVTYFGRPTQ